MRLTIGAVISAISSDRQADEASSDQDKRNAVWQKQLAATEQSIRATEETLKRNDFKYQTLAEAHQAFSEQMRSDTSFSPRFIYAMLISDKVYGCCREYLEDHLATKKKEQDRLVRWIAEPPSFKNSFKEDLR